MKIDRHNTAGGNYLDKAGTFEAFIYGFSTSINSKGNNQITINYRIRTDVEQEAKGARVDFASTFNDSEIGEKYINDLIVNANVDQAKLPDGDNASLTKIGTALLGKPVKITNKRVPKYNDATKTVNNITFVEPTDYPDVAEGERKGRIAGDVTDKENGRSGSTHRNTAPHQPADPFAGNGEVVDIKDSDLPF